jgi:Mrp family chromosome partitioning ATPase
MISMTRERIEAALREVMDPELGRNIVELGMVRHLHISDGDVEVILALTTLDCPFKEQLVDEARQAILKLPEATGVEVKVEEMTQEEKGRLGLGEGRAPLAQAVNRVQHSIAVMSGKGGVGKSLLTALMAISFARDGFRVGVLDADITGPSIPKIFGLTARPAGSRLGILPVASEAGIEVMSINLILPHEDDAVVWRGPLIAGAIKQFWEEVVWGELDYLFIDLPPGTADAPLTVMQSIPLDGVILVTSPQELAVMVVRKARQMAELVNVPILGLVENMSYFLCPDNGKVYWLFGQGRAEEAASEMGVPLLGQLPIDPRIATLCDRGAIEDYRSEHVQRIKQGLMDVMADGETAWRNDMDGSQSPQVGDVYDGDTSTSGVGSERRDGDVA